VNFVFSENISVDPDMIVQRGMDSEGTRRVLEAAYEGLSAIEDFQTESLEALLRPMAAELGVKVGQLLGTLRVATTGQKVSPPIFESMEVLGRERSLESIKKAASLL
jgi:glutamyl-tRNA synthetase